MGASDYLQTVRGSGYKPPEKDGKSDMPQDPDESNNTTRIIKLSDEEQKVFQGAKPGQELACEVRGNMEEDGHFHVMSVSPMDGASSYGEDKMSDQVAQKVNPFMGMMGK